MDPDDLRCPCGKLFGFQNALSNHLRTCGRSKRRLADLLEKAHEAWTLKQDERAQKRQRRKPGPHGNDQISSQLEASDTNSASSTAAPESNLMDVSIIHEIPADSIVEIDRTTRLSRSTPNLAEEPPEPPEDLDLPIAQRKSKRSTRRPGRFKDMLPTSTLPLDDATIDINSIEPLMEDPASDQMDPEPASHPPPGGVRSNDLPINTRKNSFHLYRSYLTLPLSLHDPEEGEISTESHMDPSDTAGDDATVVDKDMCLGPYPNLSSFLLGEWYWESSQKSYADFAKLVDVLKRENFSIDDVKNVSWARVNRELAGSLKEMSASKDTTKRSWIGILDDAEWTQEEVRILVPFNRSTGNAGTKEFVVGNFYRRSIVSVLKERLGSSESKYFHLEPYEMYWQPDDKPRQRVYGELYTSPAFITEHKRLQDSPPEPDCSLQRVIAALMFASDETHLTQFGETKLWPLYLFFGNESKYRRVKPSLHLCNHIAYFIRLPDTFKDFVRRRCENGKGPTTSLTSHCLRETIHSQWKTVFDDEFMEAYRHGVVLRCDFDGVSRHFYPRVFTLSADYKEKVILANIRNLGNCPCPRCLIPMESVYDLGTVQDRWWRTRRPRVDNAEYRESVSRARDLVLEKNYAVNGKVVEEILSECSLVPSENAFSCRLSPEGFNVFEAMVVDVMHEIESGKWRSLFIHLLRILECIGAHMIIEMDHRFRSTPSFKYDTIRKFRKNCSEMKNMAARDWEDMLQCAIPVFEGLLPDADNDHLLNVLFVLAEWHGISKLRMHTDGSLKYLDDLTTIFGDFIRVFNESTCVKFDTRELLKETNARNRRAQTQTLNKATNATTNTPGHAGLFTPGRRQKSLNLSTYKFHSMGDYVHTIKHFGTVDSYSTEPGELEHRTPKARYRRTNKKDLVKQITRIERRQARIRRIRNRIGPLPGPRESNASLLEQYYLGQTQNRPIDILSFLRQHAGDPAVKNFLPNLKSHLLPRARLLFKLESLQADSSERIPIFFQRDRIYQHRVIRFNYTTYDVRRDQDVVNPNTSQCNVMLLVSDPSPDRARIAHPYLYARIIGIFHVNLCAVGEDATAKRMDFLWVRWYQHSSPLSRYRLEEIRFPPLSSKDAFGFVDPANVLRACHIIPAFSTGRRAADGRGVSKFAHDSDDWQKYYVGRFSDRDLLMRFHWGKAVGHIGAYENRDLVLPVEASLTTGLTQLEIRKGTGRRDLDLVESDSEVENCEVLRDRENEELGSEGSDQEGEWEDDLNDEEFADVHCINDV